jgi:hypothetical protein
VDSNKWTHGSTEKGVHDLCSKVVSLLIGVRWHGNGHEIGLCDIMRHWETPKTGYTRIIMFFCGFTISSSWDPCEAWDLEVLLDLFMEAYGFLNMNICQCVGTYIHSIVAQDSMSKSNVWFWVSQTIRILQFAQIACTRVPWRWVTPAKRAWTLVSDFCKHQRHNGIGITWD